MTISHGMDIAAVRQLSAQMDQSAGQIEALMTQLTNALENTAWVGPDRTRFVGEWQGTHVAQLTAVANSLRDASNAARTNADQQEQVSA